MKETGRVVEITDTQARIEVASNKACRTCPASLVCRPHGTVRYVEAENHVDAQVGDEVCFETSTRQSMTAIVLVFGVPVVLALIGLIVGATRGNLLSIILGVIGFATGLAVAKIVNNLFSPRHFLPRITEITRHAKDLTL
ncbi:hypothetical protein AMJ87_03060 [candidate division WOR_3 bacterium SM23_60]|uniref:Fis family transcriptional regulator n=1 Tax=candidate division WOR_3 bacterium SM23_60 TaxID=1703780 RepID=A0A0S8GJ27_UNCW3|nr:MAG: hypothetical protein AMJ87_03060 [candidate division WOR_3 bacterium SM23_60]